MLKEKVMILGAVQGEVPLVNAFQKMGYFVIIIGKGMNYPCCAIADKVYDVDMMDYENVLSIAREEKICAITSNVVERAIRIVARVAEQLNLVGIGYEVSKIFTNKYKMRIAAKNIGVGVPCFKQVSCVDEAIEFAKENAYPLIIKPVDNGGSKGVQKINTDQELIDYFEASLNQSVADKKVIIEQYIEGEEYIVDAFTHNYHCDNTDIAIKRKFDIEQYFVSKAVIVQDADSSNSQIEQMILSENKKLVEGIKLKFGITHGEYIYNRKENKVYLVEITARGGGVYLSSHLTPLATGINVNELLAYYALGIDILHGNRLQLKNGAAAWYTFALPEGKVLKIMNLERAKNIEGVEDIILSNLFEGKHIDPLKDDSGKFGPIIVSATSREKCDEIFNKVKHELLITVKTNNGVKGIIW